MKYFWSLSRDLPFSKMFPALPGELKMISLTVDQGYLAFFAYYLTDYCYRARGYHFYPVDNLGAPSKQEFVVLSP